MPSRVVQSSRCLSLATLFAATAMQVNAQVYRWDTGQLCPGTQNIPPGPGANFSGLLLDFAFLRGTALNGSNFSGASMFQAAMGWANLTSANFSGANLTSAEISSATLLNADFSGAIIKGADLRSHLPGSITESQLYSTASYQNRDLAGIKFGPASDSGKFQGWNFASQDMSSAVLSGIPLRTTNFTGANLASANLRSSFFVSANFSGANLTSADLTNADVTAVDFTGALIAGANFWNSSGSGGFGRQITSEQIRSTASYKNRDLRGINLSGAVIDNLDLASFDLSFAVFATCNLASTNFAGATIVGASFENTTSRGFTASQLYSTLSYRDKELGRVALSRNDLTGWNFASQNLISARFSAAVLTSTDFTLADLRQASVFLPVASTITRGAILNDGSIRSFSLATGETLRIRAHRFPAKAAGAITGSSNTAISLDAGAALILNADANAYLAVGSLTLGTGAILTSNNNDIIIDYVGSSPISELLSYMASEQIIAADRSAGLPTYLAIAENLDLNLGEYLGIAIDNTAIVMKYTYVGDANLDGLVDVLDYERVDLAIGDIGVLGPFRGDLNYDGIVNALDYERIDLNIGNGVGAPLSGYREIDPLGADSSIEKIGVSPLEVVLIPEPSVLCCIAGFALLRSRRR